MKSSSFLASLISLLLFAPQTVFARNHFFGVTAANSVGGTGSYTCRTQEQWNQVANDARGLGMSSIRIMGFDCNALEMASAACAQAGIKLMAGIYIQGTVAAASGGIDNQVQDFRTAVGKYGAERYVGLTVGNEAQDSADYEPHLWDRLLGMTEIQHPIIKEPKGERSHAPISHRR